MIIERKLAVADALEQPLLLPQDMADLRTLKKHELFLIDMAKQAGRVGSGRVDLYFSHEFFYFLFL